MLQWIYIDAVFHKHIHRYDIPFATPSYVFDHLALQQALYSHEAIALYDMGSMHSFGNVCIKHKSLTLHVLLENHILDSKVAIMDGTSPSYPAFASGFIPHVITLAS